MNAHLYLKPGVVGIAFNTAADRDAFWKGLNGVKGFTGMERFGNRTIRILPDKAVARVYWDVDIDGKLNRTPEPTPDPVPVTSAAPPKAEATVHASAIRPPDPISPVAIIPPETTVTATTAVQPPPEPVLNPPPTIKIPEVSTPNQNLDPEPQGDKRSREWRQWKARQKG